LTLEQVRWLAAQVAAGLAYSHTMTIIHRDLNPENIMIDRQGTAKMRFMSEYGMARLLKSGSLESRVSKLAGPPTYQAPEQIAGEPADHRVDIYSLGAVMYHMVTGQPPFPGQDALAVARAVATETPPAPSEVVWGLPNDWDTLIRRAMHRHPDARFPTAVAMEVAIRALPAPGSVPQAMESAEEREEAPVQEEPAITCFNCGQVSRGRFCPNCGTRLVHP
jgi:serine/threonine-protein kinase